MVNLIFFLFMTCFASSGIEEQRKYNFENQIETDQISNWIREPLAEFNFFQHSVYKNYDIYFDTSNFDLKKSGFSFRLRRSEKTIGHYDYSIQFKSEMTIGSEVRMEKEYKDFSKQFIENERVDKIIDQFIANVGEREKLSIKMSKWVDRKKTSSLAPFQELRRLKIQNFTYAPVLIGYSQRLRFHIYKNHMKASKKDTKFLDEFFKTHFQATWLMEASFDLAEFSPVLNPNSKNLIAELEIENKFRPRAQGTQLMNEFEKLIIEKWHAKVGKDSKYLQSVKALFKDGSND